MILLAFASVYILWGSTYLAIRYTLETLPPFMMAGMRFLLAGGLLYGFARLWGHPRPAPHFWRSTAIIGGFLLLGGNGFVVWSELRIPSGMTALLVGFTPLWIVLFEWLVFRAGRPPAGVLIGISTGFAGLMMLVGPTPQAHGSRGLDLLGAASVVLACFCWAIGSLYARRAKLPGSALLTNAMEMLCGGALLLAVGLLSGEGAHFSVHAVTLRSVAAFFYLVVFGSLLGFSSYIYVLHHTTPALATTYAYVNPVVAMFLGWALAGEPLTARTLISAAVIVFSVVLITTQQRPAQS